MGASISSLSNVTNDFELVARASKELDKMLAEDFDLSEYRQLGEKIEALEEQRVVKGRTIANMRRLVRLRNELMHNYDCNSLADRHTNRYEFHQLYSQTKTELDTVINQRRGQITTLDTVNSGRWLAERSEESHELGGWGLLAGAAVGIGMIALAASNNDEDDEQRRHRRTSSHF